VDEDVAPPVTLERDASGLPYVIGVSEIDAHLASAVEHNHGVIVRQPLDDRPADRAGATRHNRHPPSAISGHGRARQDSRQSHVGLDRASAG
jgi:hypothetical protein